MRTPRLALIPCVLGVWVCATSAAAQVLEPPARPYRGLFGGGPPPDPTRSRQELSMGGNLLGGYDDNLVPPAGGSPVVPYPSGYTAFWDAGMKYRLGSDLEWLDIRGRGLMNTYRNVGVGPGYGGEESIRARTTFGRRTSLEVAQDYRSLPYYTLGLFGVIQGFDITATPDVSPTTAIAESRSQGLEGSALLSHNWTRRTRTDFGVSYSKQIFDGLTFDRSSLSGTVAVDRGIDRHLSFGAAYRPSDSTYIDASAHQLPMQTHTIDGGLTYRRRFSRTRQLSWSFGVGPQYVRVQSGDGSTPLTNSWEASGYGTLRWDLGRSWSIAGDFRRSVSVPEGLTPQPFMTNAALATFGGFLRKWLEGVVSVGYSNGTAGQLVGGAISGEYDGVAVTTQARFAVARFWSAVVSYSHYQYYLNEVASLSMGVPPELRRNAVRAGLAWSVPLHGSFRDGPPTPTEGRD